MSLLFALAKPDELRLPWVLGLSAARLIGSVAFHLWQGMPSADWDSRVVYTPQGNTLLAAHYPASEYPPGAPTGGRQDDTGRARRFAMTPSRPRAQTAE